MGGPLEGIKVVEVAMWAFVPAAGGILSDMGAAVIKVEPPNGDPLRGLQIGMTEGQTPSFDFSWESYNRGKQSITLDLKQKAGIDVLYRLLDGADVFLTNLLPRARRQMGIDHETLRARFPKLIYATGSALGQKGPESEKGGFDSITFWGRGGVSSSLTEENAEHPVGPPGPAFGDTLSGSMLAGGICAAIAKRAMTGESSSVEVSLFGAAMWAMQRTIAQSTFEGITRFPRPRSDQPNNVLVNNYQTSDKRFIALGMLQSDKFWPRFCEVAGRPDLARDPRYIDAAARKANVGVCLAELRALFVSKTLAEWREILAQQDGQWDAIQYVGEINADRQAQANRYVQSVDADDQKLPLVSVPMQFDGAPLPTRRAPELGRDNDALLAALGYSEHAILELKVAGVVF